MIVGYNASGDVIIHAEPVRGIFIGGAFEPKHMSSQKTEAYVFDGTQTFGEGSMAHDEPIEASRGSGIPSLLEGIEQKHVLLPTRTQAGYVPTPKTKPNTNLFQ
jgi:hypothetical protein